MFKTTDVEKKKKNERNKPTYWSTNKSFCVEL